MMFVFINIIPRHFSPYFTSPPPQGATALHYAAFGGHTDVIDTLLAEAGPGYINCKDSEVGLQPCCYYYDILFFLHFIIMILYF